MTIDKAMLRNSIADQIRSSLGYSTVQIVDFVLRASKKSSSPTDLAAKLIDYEFPSSPETHSLAQHVFSHFSPIPQSDINQCQQAEKKGEEEFTWKHKRYRFHELDNKEQGNQRPYRRPNLEDYDPGYLFKDVKLTEEEECLLRLKRKMYELEKARFQAVDNASENKMPGAGENRSRVKPRKAGFCTNPRGYSNHKIAHERIIY